MIFKSIKLKNFRQYKNEIYFDFSLPVDGKSNISLFIAANGVGKTTLLQAFRYCFYGKSSNYLNLPKADELINNTVIDDLKDLDETEMIVEVIFIHEGLEYIALRKTSFYKSKSILKETGKEQFYLSCLTNSTEGYKPFKEAEANDKIRSILPEGLSQVFMFDGERMERSINDKKFSNELKESILGILDLKKYDKLVEIIGSQGKGNTVIGLLSSKKKTRTEEERLIKSRYDSFLETKNQLEKEIEELNASICEIELLIDKDSQLTRIFQAELDGINQKGRIFVMATANDVSMLNGALLRAGRFGKRIHIDYPDKKTRERLFEKFLSLFNIPLDNIDLNHIARVCASCNGASIKAIANDVYLRCRQNASTEDIEESYGRVVSHDACEDIPDNVKNMTVAIHEAGHALMTMHFKNDFTFYQAKYTGSGGITETYETNENLDTISKRESVIQISMAGYLAERVINGRHNVGSYEDYQKAFDHCTRLIERVCINGIKNLIPWYRSNGDRYESDKKRIANERQVIRLLKKYERKTLNFLKKNKEALRDFANVLFEKGKVTHRDILSFNNKENSSMAGSLISSFAHRYTDDKNQQVQI